MFHTTWTHVPLISTTAVVIMIKDAFNCQNWYLKCQTFYEMDPSPKSEEAATGISGRQPSKRVSLKHVHKKITSGHPCGCLRTGLNSHSGPVKK